MKDAKRQVGWGKTAVGKRAEETLKTETFARKEEKERKEGKREEGRVGHLTSMGA